jgi:hypothetical protein
MNKHNPYFGGKLVNKTFFRAPRPLGAILVASLLVITIATLVQSAAACNVPDKYNPYNPPGNPWPWQHNGFGKWIVLHDGGWGFFGGFGDGWGEYRNPYG